MIGTKVTSLQRSQLGLALLLVFALLAGFYTSARFAGWIAQGDALSQINAAQGTLTAGNLINPGRYSNGFAYGALLAVTSQVSGISPNQLITWGSVWIAVFALVAFIAYRELLGDARLAALSTLLLFLIPDFLFYVLRGGHERITWMLALLMLFLLARSLHHAQNPGLLLVHILCFYLVFWAMAATNVYFASTFVNAIILALLGAWMLGYISRSRVKDGDQRQPLLRRLLIISLACVILVFVFITYTYPPALNFYNLAGDLVNRLGLLLFGAQEMETSSSFEYLGNAWVNPGVYLALVGPQFLLAAASFGVWAFDLRKQFSFDHRRWLLWWLYAASGVLLVVGTLADFTGFLQQNLQLRMFTPFALFIAPLAALGLQSLFKKLSHHMPRFAMLFASVCVVYGLLATMLKVTNDPAVSNAWFFYTPGELQAGQWMNERIQNQTAWVDSWNNLPVLLASTSGSSPNRTVIYRAGLQPLPAPYVLITEKTLLRANRINYVLPATYDRNRIYDNGAAWLYYRRARTPYQR